MGQLISTTSQPIMPLSTPTPPPTPPTTPPRLSVTDILDMRQKRQFKIRQVEDGISIRTPSIVPMSKSDSTQTLNGITETDEIYGL